MRSFTSAFLHCHALRKRSPLPSLFFNSLASSPDAVEVGACTPEIRAGPLATSPTILRKTQKLKKAEKIGCGSLDADTSASVAKKSRPTSKSKKAKADVAGEKAGKVLESEDAHVQENAATHEAMRSAFYAKSVFDEEKALPNAAADRSGEIVVDAAERANAGMVYAKEELSQWAAKLDLKSFKSGLRWMETAYKLLDYGISPAHVKSMIQKCRNLPCGLTADSVLEHFAMLGMSHEQIGRVISRWPTILNSSDISLQSKVEFFESVGIDKCALAKAMHKAYRVMTLSCSILRARYEFWNNYFQDVEKNMVRTMIAKNPQILTWSLMKVKTDLAYLEDLGLIWDKKALLKGASVLSYNMKTFALKIKVLEQFGPSDRVTLTKIYLALHSLSIGKLEERLHNLFVAGFSFDQVKKMIAMCPLVLAYTEDRTNLRLDYAVNVLHVPLDVLAVCPPFWSCSFEKRVKYRYDVLQKLKALKVDYRACSMGYMLSMSDATFTTKFLKTLEAHSEDNSSI